MISAEAAVAVAVDVAFAVVAAEVVLRWCYWGGTEVSQKSFEWVFHRQKNCTHTFLYISL